MYFFYCSSGHVDLFNCDKKIVAGQDMVREMPHVIVASARLNNAFATSAIAVEDVGEAGREPRALNTKGRTFSFAKRTILE